jgi:hypothetical protein
VNGFRYVQLVTVIMMVVVAVLSLLQPLLAGKVLRTRLEAYQRRLDAATPSRGLEELRTLVRDVIDDPRTCLDALAAVPPLPDDLGQLTPLADQIPRAVREYAVHSTYRTATAMRRRERLAAIPAPAGTGPRAVIHLPHTASVDIAGDGATAATIPGYPADQC